MQETWVQYLGGKDLIQKGKSLPPDFGTLSFAAVTAAMKLKDAL